MGEPVAADPWYRCSRSGPGLCYWDGPHSSLAGVNRDRCPVCLALAVPDPLEKAIQTLDLSQVPDEEQEDILDSGSFGQPI